MTGWSMSKRRIIVAISLTVVLSLLGKGAWAKKAEQAQPAPPRPPLPEIVSLQLEPDSVTLQDAADARQVLVWGVAKDGTKFDLSYEAKFEASSPVVSVDPAGFVSGREAGEETVTIQAAGKQATLSVKVLKSDHPPVRFT